MTDKKTPPKTTHDKDENKRHHNSSSGKKNNTEAPTTALNSDVSAKSKPHENTKAHVNNPTETKTLTSTNKHSSNNKQNKIAWLAIIIALSTSAATGGLYYWQNLQQSQIMARLSQQIVQQKHQFLQQSKQQTQQLLTAQQHAFTQQLQQALKKNAQQQQSKISQLETAITRLSQRQPSDWLIHESEYLIRVAARSIWLERDTSAAINLLKDADNRLKQLNSPEFLPVRQLIHQDIEQLSLLPQRETDEVILSLIGLNQQIKQLPLSKITRLDEKSAQQAFQLSENPADWQDNLKKSWQKFISDFITIRRRTNNVEPLLSPEYQQNLRQNLSLKLQLAQWAANQGKTKVYQAALNDVLSWQQQYFDMEDPINKNFHQKIKKLSKAIIAVNYPKTLASLQAIHHLLNATKQLPAEVQSKPQKKPTKSNAATEMPPTTKTQPNGAEI